MGAGIRVQDPGIYEILWDHEQRIKNHDLRGDDRWIYVGTIGIDGVDDLITPDSPPFVLPWTNILGDDAPVSFRRTLNGWVHLRGGFTGGDDNSVIFVLPEGFRPAYRQPLILPSSNGLAFTTVIANPNGEVVYVTTV